MLDTTFVQAQSLKVSLSELNKIKAELAAPETQEVIRLTKRKLPAAPPVALTNALEDVESFLLAQAVVSIDDQITAMQAQFDALQDSES